MAAAVRARATLPSSAHQPVGGSSCHGEGDAELVVRRRRYILDVCVDLCIAYDNVFDGFRETAPHRAGVERLDIAVVVHQVDPRLLEKLPELGEL